MADAVLPTHEALLRLFASATPQAWYPGAYVRDSGIARGGLDSLLNDLRVAGLVRLTEWEKGRGQGYVLTDLGDEVLKSPVLLAQLRADPRQTATAVAAEPSQPPPDPAELSTYERGEVARRALYEPTPPRVMPLLLLVNLIAFAISFYVAVRANVPVEQFAGQGNIRVLHEVGALSAVDLLHGEWWRLLTCCFLHFGLPHLLLNMYCLYSLGLLESLWGSPRYLLIYLASGIGGSCSAVLYNPGSPHEQVVLAGASGCIWGMMTSLAVWVLLNRRHLPPDRVAQWVPWFVLMFAINISVSFLPGVSAPAHFGGAAVGLLTALILQSQRYAPPPRRNGAIALCLLLPILCMAAVQEAINKDPRWQRLADVEKAKLQIKDVMHFKKDVLPAIDEADKAFDGVENTAFILSDKPPVAREADKRFAKLRVDLAAAAQLAKDALDKFGERPKADDILDVPWRTARNYMEVLLASATRFEELFNQGKSWEPDERAAFSERLKKARVVWKAMRGDY